MPFDQFHLVYGDHVSFTHHESSADHSVIRADRVTKNRRRHRVVQRSGVVKAIKVDRKEVGTFPGFQASNIRPAQHSCPTARGKAEGLTLPSSVCGTDHSLRKACDSFPESG